MDTRNVIAAISLSAAVIVLYSLFFLPDPQTKKDSLTNNKKIEQNTFESDELVRLGKVYHHY